MFTPDDTTAFSASAGSKILTVAPTPLTMPLTMTLSPAGTFSLTVDSADTITMTVSGSTATATLNPVVVTDTRNTYPGWAVSGQAAGFTGAGTAAGSSFSGDRLGWTPIAVAVTDGVTLGPTVAPVMPGLGTTAANLASAPAGGGFGTSTLSANLTLAIPALTRAGLYNSAVTLSVVTAFP
jgi:hypothetical protein